MPRIASGKQEEFAELLGLGETVTDAARVSGAVLTEPNCATGFYVYLLIDPRDDFPFYVGKGCKDRAKQHEKDWQRGFVQIVQKHQKIGEIRSVGLRVKAVCFISGLSEPDALHTERWLIGEIGFSRLSNIVNGTSDPIETARVQAITCANRNLKKIMSYCPLMWKGARRNDGYSYEEREALYWDIVGGFADVIAAAQGKKPLGQGMSRAQGLFGLNAAA